MANGKTPNQRLEELRRRVAEEREKLRQNQAMTPNEMAQSVAVLLAGHALETGALHETGTVRAIDDTWDKHLAFFEDQMRGFIPRIGAKDLKKLALAPDGGAGLGKAFTRYIQTLDRIPEEMPPQMMGSASYRIARMKERMRGGEFDLIDRKRFALAEIIAARESVQAGRDTMFTYDWHLSEKMPPDVSRRARKVEQELERLPEEQIDRLFSLAMGRGAGQRMLDAFEKTRRTPVQREMQAVKESGYSVEGDIIRRAAAQLLWLDRNREMTQQELDEAKAEGTMDDEVAEIADSLEFKRMVKGFSEEELGNLVQNVDVSSPEGMKALTDAYDEAVREQQRFDREYDPFYQELFVNEAGRNRLMENLGNLVNNEDFHKAIKDGSVGNVTLDTLTKLNDALFEDDPQTVKEAIELARAQLTNMRFGAQNKEGFRQLGVNFAAFQGVLDDLKLPQQGTLKEFDMSLRASILYEGVESLDNKVYMVRRAALAREARQYPDWENQPADVEKIVAEAQKLENAMSPLGNITNDLSFEKAYRILSADDGGAKADAEFTSWAEEKTRQLREAEKKSPEERMEDLLRLPERENYLKQKVHGVDDGINVVKEIMAARVLSREYRENPESFQTTRQVEERLRDIKGSFGGFSRALNYIQDKKMDLVSEDRSGQKLEAAFKKAMIGEDGIWEWRRMDPAMYPTAREQIEGLQRRMKQNELSEKGGKLSAIAQILAVRETLGVQRGVRGGDARLDRTMTREALERASQIRETLQELPEAEFSALFERAKEGHGGAMEQEYRSMIRRQNAARDALGEDLPPDAMPTARERIKALQDRMRTLAEPAEKLKCVAGIIAARQTVGAKRGNALGGDEKLNDRLDAGKLAERQRDVELYLANIPVKTQQKLLSQALDGHGGAMMETYKAANTYKLQLDALQEQALRNEPVDMAKVLALAPLAKNVNEPINEENVRRNVQQVRKEKGYEEFAKDPKSYQLLQNGSYLQLASKYLTTVSGNLEIKSEMKPAEAGKQEAEVRQQEAEAELGAGLNG